MKNATLTASEKLDAKQAKIEASKLFKKRMFQGFLSVIFFILGITCVFAIVACIIGFVAIIVLYVLGNAVASALLTIFQVITGLFSLAVGIWGLCLALQAKNNTSPPVEGITKTTVASDLRKVYGEETDVDQESIG